MQGFCFSTLGLQGTFERPLSTFPESLDKPEVGPLFESVFELFGLKLNLFVGYPAGGRIGVEFECDFPIYDDTPAPSVTCDPVWLLCTTSHLLAMGLRLGLGKMGEKQTRFVPGGKLTLDDDEDWLLLFELDFISGVLLLL